MKKYSWLVALVLVVCMVTLVSTESFAWGGGHYSYRGGRWYNNGWFWGGLGAALVAGAVVASLPPRVVAVPVNGMTYYTDGQYYYLPNAYGQYVVVAPPVQQVVVAPQVIQAQPVYVQPQPVQQQPVQAGAPVADKDGKVIGYVQR